MTTIFVRREVNKCDDGEFPNLRHVSLPQKMYNLLQGGRESASITWSSNGKTFEIIEEEFVKIIPRYFGSTKFSSIKRNLYYYGFQKCSKNRYFHPFFTRNNPAAISILARRKDKAEKINIRK